MDPLAVLPPEIVLRVLDFASVSSVATLHVADRAWHHFIDHLHQDAIYASPSKTDHPAGAKDLSFLDDSESFDRYYEGTASWKDLCRKQTILKRNYASSRPTVTDNFIVPLFDANRVWRFRADLKRRFFICTSQDGGLSVTDMDGKGRLWHLAHDEVPPFAHLEYNHNDAMAIWSLLGNTLEVWTADATGLPRGRFRRVATLQCPLHHLRGFHLAFNTLCVVGDDGQGLVYDMTREPPELRLCLEIREHAVGHLCQAEEAIMYTMQPIGYGEEDEAGFHIHDKASGELLGKIKPHLVTKLYHIVHPRRATSGETDLLPRHLPPMESYAVVKEHSQQIMTPIEVNVGPLPFAAAAQEMRCPLDQDEWGAGLLAGDLMVGISKGGRVLVCSNWREAVKSDGHFVAYTALIECEDNEENFTLGGWLSIKDNRILFEIADMVYCVALNTDGTIATGSRQQKRPSWCFFSSLNLMQHRRLQSGISMMQLMDDCIMTTCWVSLMLVDFQIG